MAYTAPPTFVDGDILLASQLNVIGDDLVFLQGIAGRVNVPFLAFESPAGSGISARYRLRHLHRYFHYRLSQLVGTDDSLEIVYGGVTIYSDGGDRTAPHVWSDVIDLNDTGIISPTPTMGAWYEIETNISQDSGSGVTLLEWYRESDSATL